MGEEKIRTFTTQKEIERYLLKKLYHDNEFIFLRGSTARKPARAFSDLDVEVYSNTKQKPYYEIVLLRNKPILITVYFYRRKKGNPIAPPSSVKVLSGEYTDTIQPNFSPDTYSPKEKMRRECQMTIGFLFKYLRSGNKEYLKSVQKRI